MQGRNSRRKRKNKGGFEELTLLEEAALLGLGRRLGGGLPFSRRLPLGGRRSRLLLSAAGGGSAVAGVVHGEVGSWDRDGKLGFVWVQGARRIGEGGSTAGVLLAMKVSRSILLVHGRMDGPDKSQYKVVQIRIL